MTVGRGVAGGATVKTSNAIAAWNKADLIFLMDALKRGVSRGLRGKLPRPLRGRSAGAGQRAQTAEASKAPSDSAAGGRLIKGGRS